MCLGEFQGGQLQTAEPEPRPQAGSTAGFPELPPPLAVNPISWGVCGNTRELVACGSLCCQWMNQQRPDCHRTHLRGQKEEEEEKEGGTPWESRAEGQRQSACLAPTVPWVQSQHCRENKNKTKNEIKRICPKQRLEHPVGVKPEGRESLCWRWRARCMSHVGSARLGSRCAHSAAHRAAAAARPLCQYRGTALADPAHLRGCQDPSWTEPPRASEGKANVPCVLSRKGHTPRNSPRNPQRQLHPLESCCQIISPFSIPPGKPQRSAEPA